MKPTLTKFRKTDFNYTAARLTQFNGRCGKGAGNARSFREITDDYFKHEAPNDFLSEAALFAIIVITAVLPMLNNASALAHFVRAIGGV